MSYITDHPTHFSWRQDVEYLVNKYQREFPWKTFINTYVNHPPIFGRKYEFVSFDVWQGGGYNSATYSGYRGKRLDPRLGDRIFNRIFNDPDGPPIYWIIYKGRMWVRGQGWQAAPPGPADSDPGHYHHIHVTYCLYY